MFIRHLSMVLVKLQVIFSVTIEFNIQSVPVVNKVKAPLLWKHGLDYSGLGMFMCKVTMPSLGMEMTNQITPWSA